MIGLALFTKRNAIRNQSIEQQIGFLKYCHERIDELKASIHHKISIIMATLALMASAYIQAIFDFCKDYFLPNTSWHIVLGVLVFIFFVSFLCTAFCGIKCLIPGADIKKTAINAFATHIFIAAVPRNQFKEAVHTNLNSHEQLREQLINEIYDLSKHTGQRYKDMRNSYKWLYFNVFAFVLTMLYYLFIIAYIRRLA